MTPKELAQYRQTMRYLPVLVYMNILDEPVTVMDVCEPLGMAHATINRHLNALEELGMVKRTGSTKGRTWWLTARGREVAPGYQLIELSTGYPQFLENNPQPHKRAEKNLAQNVEDSIHIYPQNQPKNGASGATCGEMEKPGAGNLAQNVEDSAQNVEDSAQNVGKKVIHSPTTTTVKDSIHDDGEKLIRVAQAIAGIDGSIPYKDALKCVKAAYKEGDSVETIAEQVKLWAAYLADKAIFNKGYSIAINIRDGEYIDG